jgi:serine/threonine protein kinase
MSLTIGETLNNRYRIDDLLGQGGFGAVYRVWDINLERRCALKENLEATPEAQRQFAREARILANLNHPNLPRVTDHFMIAGQGQYLVMDYVDGMDLEMMLQHIGEPLIEAQVIKWAIQVCDALDYLHSQNPAVIHRDIKPANIKITPEGKALLVDFGISKVYDQNVATTVGARAVTPGFSPQEQYGRGTTDARTDIYALGATLYRVLTDQCPLESIERSLGQPLLPPRELNPKISNSTNEIILRAMALLPGERFQTISEFKRAMVTPPELVQVAVQRAWSFEQAAPRIDPAVSVGTLPTERVTLPESVVHGERTSDGGMDSIPLPAASRRIPWRWISIGCSLVLLLAVIGGFAGYSLLQGEDKNLSGGFSTQTVLAAIDSTVASIRPTHSTGVTEQVVINSSPSPRPTFTSRPRSSPTKSPTKSPLPGFETAIVNPYCSTFDKEATVGTNQPVFLKWCWMAKEYAQVEDHIAAVHYEIKLDGRLIPSSEQSSITFDSKEDAFKVCWSSNVGKLSPGEHRADYFVSWSKIISDGWDTYGPDNTSTSYCKITVR